MYIDGFLVPVPDDRREEYVRGARRAAEVFREHGATQVIEAWGDEVPAGELTSFTRAVALREGETVVLSWITYPDRATRDACMEKAMADPRMREVMEGAPFDAGRMVFGGFESIVEA